MPQEIYRIIGNEPFPDPTQYNNQPYGEIAVGGDLSPERLIEAYSKGIFPFYAFRLQELQWCCPMDRFVIFPDEIHVSHSMRNIFNKKQYSFSCNEAFEHVIRCCSKVDGRNLDLYAWLGPDIIKAYTKLHEMGYASSIEVWDEENYLVGGLYGVTIGECFFGESMFSLIPNGSKMALIALAKSMQGHGGLIDCQYETDHLLTMGGRHIPYEEYMTIISKSREKQK